MTPTPNKAPDSKDTELTADQHIRFNILVPLVSDMLIKHQEEAGKLTKADASGRYTEAIEQILAWHATQQKAFIEELLAKEEDMGIGIPVIRVSDVRDVLTALEQKHIGGKE